MCVAQCPPEHHRIHGCPPEGDPAGHPSPVCPPFAAAATYSIDRAAVADGYSPLARPSLNSTCDDLNKEGTRPTEAWWDVSL